MGLHVPNCELFAGRFKYKGSGLVGQEVFYTLLEVQVLTEQYRQIYNRINPHSSLGYQPPAPEAMLPAEPIPVLAGLT